MYSVLIAILFLVFLSYRSKLSSKNSLNTEGGNCIEDRLKTRFDLWHKTNITCSLLDGFVEERSEENEIDCLKLRQTSDELWSEKKFDERTSNCDGYFRSLDNAATMKASQKIIINMLSNFTDFFLGVARRTGESVSIFDSSSQSNRTFGSLVGLDF